MEKPEQMTELCKLPGSLRAHYKLSDGDDGHVPKHSVILHEPQKLRRSATASFVTQVVDQYVSVQGYSDHRMPRLRRRASARVRSLL